MNSCICRADIITHLAKNAIEPLQKNTTITYSIKYSIVVNAVLIKSYSNKC